MHGELQSGKKIKAACRWDFSGYAEVKPEDSDSSDSEYGDQGQDSHFRPICFLRWIASMSIRSRIRINPHLKLASGPENAEAQRERTRRGNLTTETQR